ncbi:MAG: acyltransferase [Polaromonas sp.]|nr:acyltransferase [Polaromonas sp.]
MNNVTRIGYLDGWRGLAIMLVLIGHFMPIAYLNLGRFGVELFFVLSGRLMADILFIQKTSLKRFYWRRFSRIYPTLILFLITCTFLYPNSWPYSPSTIKAIAAATLTINYLHSAGYGTPFFDHIWSLCIEEHMYVLLGVLALAIGNKNSKAYYFIFFIAALMIGSGIISSVLLDMNYYQTYWRSDVRGAGILIGCGLQIYRQRMPQIEKFVDSKRIVIALVLSLIFSLSPIPDFLKYSIGTCSLAFVIVFLHKAPNYMLTILQSKCMRIVGAASFSLYIWQQPFFITKLLLPNGTAFVLSVILGFLSFYFFEQPVRRLLNRHEAKI